MKLLIAIPCMDTVPTAFMRSLVRLEEQLRRDGVDYRVSIEGGTLVHIARERLAGSAANKGYTHILWLDSDMVFEPDLLQQLLHSGNEFVSGIACGRRPPFVPCVFKSLEQHKIRLFEWEEMPEDTFEVAGCGFACVLMTADVIKRVFYRFGTAFDPIRSYGEDLSFCIRAAEAGIRMYAEPRAELGHMGHIALWPSKVKNLKF